MDNVKNFIFKYRIILGIFVFLLISFGIYFFVSAEEDTYADNIEIKDASVTIKDGTANVNGSFDSNDGDGNDSSESNKIVRNFDAIQYIISYNLGYKDSSTLENKPTGISRSVIVDVLVPDSLNAKVATGEIYNPESVTPDTITIGDTTYKYYKFYNKNVEMLEGGSNLQFAINILDINMKNGDKINPIIRIRESTDSNYSDFSDNSSLSSGLLSTSEVTVTAIDNWAAKLYSTSASHSSDRLTSTLPIGILLYIPNDSNRGIKGSQIPSDIELSLNIANDHENESSISDYSISDYDSSKVSIEGMPSAYLKNNGTIGKDNISVDGNTYKLKYSGLTYQENSVNIGTSDNQNMVKYISSKTLVLTTKRVENSKNDITYTLTGNNVANSISIIDNYVPIVGNYSSKVEFKNSRNDSSVVDANSAVYNYNEEFYIENTITYASRIGDTLTKGFTNYLKIDNTAIRIIDIGNVSDQAKDYYIDDNGATYTVQYAVGKWDPSYFKVKSGAPSYCPSNLSSLSKEELMNYYGGPCIEENSSSVIWYNSLKDAANADSNNTENIIAIKLDVTSSYDSGTITMDFKAIVKNDSNLSGNTYQITSRGKTIYNGTDFYMSNPSEGIPVNLTSQSSDIKYTKMSYDGSTITAETSNGQDGNSILVTSAKARISDIVVSDKYGIKDKTIYARQNDPTTIQISPIVLTNDYDASIGDISVDVYLPKTLTIDVQTGDKNYSSTKSETYQNEEYNIYTYKYLASEISSSNNSSSGTIPTLTIHANVSLTTENNTSSDIYARVYGNVKIGGTDVAINNPESKNEKIAMKTVLLCNSNSIGSLGTTSPTYIDKNGSYTYNIMAYNLSGTAANINLLYVLPYDNDGLLDTYGSKFSGTIKSAIEGTLPTGYIAYYTTDNSKTVLSNEISSSSSVTWKTWTNYNTALSGITAIKIVPSGNIASNSYFASESGIKIKLTTSNNKEADIYYNKFYILHKNASVCSDSDCTSTTTGLGVYSSNVSSSSIYNRTISGIVFEDEDYDGFSSDSETKLQNIAVDLYKTTATVEDLTDPISVISDNDTKIAETTTDSNGKYNFSALTSGTYYVKYTFDCDKYTVTDKNVVDVKKGDTSGIDSDAVIISGTCSAVSNIISLNDNNTVNANNIDLGLKVRQTFDVKVDKYITNVTVTSNKGVESHDYDRKKQVKLDLKNLKNTSFRVTYTIEFENTKYFPGTIGNIIETIPDGMTFNPDLTGNEGWYESDGYLYYDGFSSSLLMPGEKYYVTIVLDLVTESGGDYINFVAISDLQVQSILSDLTEVKDDSSYIITDEEPTEEETGEGE